MVKRTLKERLDQLLEAVDPSRTHEMTYKVVAQHYHPKKKGHFDKIVGHVIAREGPNVSASGTHYEHHYHVTSHEQGHELAAHHNKNGYDAHYVETGN